MHMKKRNLITGILAAVLVLLLAGGGIVGNMMGVFHKGNHGQYDLSHTAVNAESPLRGRTVIFLGSSVTQGYGSLGVSFVDYLEQVDGVTAVKEAVSGTTLADLKRSSYVARMQTIDPAIKADAFVCQLSTNDATKGVPLGAVAAGFDPASFDTQTVAGAIEYIIAYARETWRCPVIFYTQARYDSDAYAQMVALLQKIRQKWQITVIDLWNDADFNAVTDEERSLYLVDAIHPTKAGYRDWWLGKFEKELDLVF